MITFPERARRDPTPGAAGVRTRSSGSIMPHQVAVRILCFCSCMYLIMAYCFVAFTAIMVAGLLFLGWQHHRDEARHEEERKEALTRG
jgi:cytochrome b subunit of formate dehydrogenase